jgi:hypothetical protein
MATPKEKREYILLTLGLYGYGLATYSPGDRYTRYRITKQSNNGAGEYFGDDAIYTGSMNDVYTYCHALRYIYNNRSTIEYIDLYSYKCHNCGYNPNTNAIVLLTDVQHYERLPNMLSAAKLYAYYRFNCFIDQRDIIATCLYSNDNGSVYECTAHSQIHGPFSEQVYISQYSYRPLVNTARNQTI